MLQKTVPVCVSWPRAKYTTGLFAGKNLTCIAEGLKLLVYFFFFFFLTASSHALPAYPAVILSSCCAEGSLSLSLPPSL